MYVNKKLMLLVALAELQKIGSCGIHQLEFSVEGSIYRNKYKKRKFGQGDII
jgi:hypothetical protein